MVAPSFQSMTVMSEIYQKNNKAYIDVKNEKTGTIRSVRWYTVAEYAKAYGGKAGGAATDGFSGLKQARGFSRGPIMLIRNTKAADEAWLGASKARYATDIGWYVASTDGFPVQHPEHFRFLSLSWEEFAADERHAKTPDELKRIIKSKEKNNEYILTTI